MDVKLNTIEMLEIAKKVVSQYSGQLSGDFDMTMHGLELKVEYYCEDYDEYPPELGISDISCKDEAVFVSFDARDERFAMSIAGLSTFRFNRV